MSIAGTDQLLIFRLLAVFAFVLTSCMSQRPLARATTPTSSQEIRYVSTDLGFVMVFSDGQAGFGVPLIVGYYSFQYIRTDENVQCISMRVTGGVQQFAIKRPIRAGARYHCLGTAFRVSRCFLECQAAIIEVDIPLSGGVEGMRTAYMYVDSCLGLLAYSRSEDFNRGMPLGAAWLRGDIGILADPHFLDCDRP
jgi:hypothetical protein